MRSVRLLLDSKERLLAPSSRRRLATDNTVASNKSTVAKINKKRQRPHKSLALPKAPETTRDRIRWLQDHNEVLTDNHYRTRAIDRRIDDLGNTAEERLNYWRDKIFDFWRNGGSFTTATQESAAANSAAVKKNLRPAKKPLQMDAKWWFWNISFALLPAALLTAYFELIAKPEMLEYNRIVHILKQRHLLGDSYKEEEDEELARLMEESSQTFATRIYNAVRELSMYFYWGQVVVPQEENSLPSSSPTLAITRKESGTAPDLKNTPANNNHVTVNPNIKKDDIVEEEATIAELKKKLEELEMRLKEKKSTDESDNNSGSRQPAPSESAAGSRIHARVMQQRGGEEASRVEKQLTPWERFSGMAGKYILGGGTSSTPEEKVDAVAAPNRQEDSQKQPTPINESIPDKGQHNSTAKDAADTGTHAIKKPMKQSETGSVQDPDESGGFDDKDLNLSTSDGNAKNTNSWWKRLWPKSG